MADDVLSPRALNRATLARQLLLERADLPVLEAVTHLVGLQAQLPLDPYTALWSRLEAFDPIVLAQHLIDRDLVRIVVMRTTIHLVTAADCLTFRPLMQPVVDQELARHGEHAPKLVGVDLDAVMDVVAPLLAEQPRTGTQLRAIMASHFPDLDAAALAYACRCRLPLVQVPPRGVWGKSMQVTVTTADSWLGRSLDARPSIDGVVLRYLAAFGPATVADISSWSRLTGQREVVDRLRPRLRVFRDERGRELFDLPDAPRPDPDTPAPPRFLPTYDNVVLSHADRARFHPAGEPPVLGTPTSIIDGSLLVDGTLAALWHLDRDRSTGTVTLVIEHARKLTRKAMAAVEGEGRRLLRFKSDGAADATAHDVRFVSAG